MKNYTEIADQDGVVIGVRKEAKASKLDRISIIPNENGQLIRGDQEGKQMILIGRVSRVAAGNRFKKAYQTARFFGDADDLNTMMEAISDGEAMMCSTDVLEGDLTDAQKKEISGEYVNSKGETVLNEDNYLSLKNFTPRTVKGERIFTFNRMVIDESEMVDVLLYHTNEEEIQANTTAWVKKQKEAEEAKAKLPK